MIVLQGAMGMGIFITGLFGALVLAGIPALAFFIYRSQLKARNKQRRIDNPGLADNNKFRIYWGLMFSSLIYAGSVLLTFFIMVILLIGWLIPSFD